MAFDPSTAELAEQSFDPSTAQAVATSFDPGSATLVEAEERASVPGWIQNELNAADEQKQLETKAAATAKPADAMRVIDAAMKLPAKAAVATGMALTGGVPYWPTNEEVSRPIVPTEAFDAIQPTGRLDKVFPNSSVAKTLSGVSKGVSEAAAGFTSLENLAMLPLGAGKTAIKLLSTVFAGKAALEFPEDWKEFNATDDIGEKAKIATRVVTKFLLPAAPFLHRGPKGEVIPESRTTVEPSNQEPVPASDSTAATPMAESSQQPPKAESRPVTPEPEFQTEAPPPDVKPSEPEIASPEAPEGFVRLYHGGNADIGQAGSDFTTDFQYAQGYADKSGKRGAVWYVDVPEGQLKTHDEYGQPMTRVVVPDEIANKAKILRQNVPEPEPTSAQNAVTDAERAGTSNRVFQEVYGEDTIPGGKGADTSAMLNDARSDISTGKVDPYEVLSRTRANGVAAPSEYATLAAEHERLVNEAVRLEKAGDPNAARAAQDAQDFATAIQPHKTAASNLMRLFQGDLNYDVSTEFGMEQYMKAELNRAPKPNERTWMRDRANGISLAEKRASASVRNADFRVQRRYAKVRDIPMEEAAARVKEWFSDCM